MKKALRCILLTAMILFSLVLPVQAATSTVKITRQPVSQLVENGQTLKASLDAEGEGLIYRWYYKNSGDKVFTYTPVFTGPSYSIEMSSTAAGRQIYCVVTDANGVSVQSDTVTLNMGTQLKIKVQPRSSTASKNTKVSVKVSASGDGLKYRWYYKNKGASKFSKSTVTSSTYSATMTSGRNGRQVYCVITDKWGKSVQTNTVKLSMGKTLKITKQPKSAVAPNGATARVSFTAQGEGLTYKWYYKNSGGSAFAYTSTFKSRTYSTTMNDQRANRQVYCVVTDKYGSSVQTNTVTLKKGIKLAITQQPSSQMVAKGKSFKVTVSATGEGLTYKWYFKNKGAKKFALTDTFTSNVYSTTMSSSRNGRQIYCVITDKYGNSVKTKTVTLTMGTALKITKQPTSVIVPKNGAIKISVGAQGDGLTYKWYYKNKGGSKFILTSAFKGNSYSTTMNSSRNGRQVYCVVKDSHGKTVKTKTVTMTMGTPVTITTQPVSAEALLNGTVKVNLLAKGDGLTYKWYYKNKGASAFTSISSVKGNAYTVSMTKETDGRSLYCVVSDKYGNKAQSKIVTISLQHIWDAGTVTREPTCSKVGKTTYHCSDCGADRVDDIAKTAHTLGQYERYREPTLELEGVDRAYCEHCSYYTDRTVAKLEPAYYITVNTGSTTYKVGVGEDGKYKLEAPTGKDGYTFGGWVDSNGKDFPESGTVSQSCTVKAHWDVTATTTLAQLKSRLESGVDRVRIAADITIDEPMFVSRKVTLYADGDYTLKRDPGYGGDMFVVGQNKSGVAAKEYHRQAELNLGGGKGTLTIDGNRGNMNATVKGSALYVTDSAVLNLYDGVRIVNHQKVGNKRVFEHDYTKTSVLERAGGAAILNFDATVNMYGGVLENNIVATKYTVVTENGSKVNKEIAGCGGAVYNAGTFNMYGGTISGNDALRGGGMYNARIAYLTSGTITNNHAYTYGGGISSSSLSYADMYIGSQNAGNTMLISNNRADQLGGGAYSYSHSPIVVLGNAVFEENAGGISGGAIYTAGPLVVTNAEFKGNTSEGSGGAIYHLYANPEIKRREMSIKDCVFEENSASLGGAVILSALSSVSKGTVGTFENCTFVNNSAFANENSSGSGGALYITRKGEATITGCNFLGNQAVRSAGGIAIQSGSSVQITDSKLQENTAMMGGGLYVSTKAVVKLTNVEFTKNAAVKNDKKELGHGGAVYLDSCPVTFNNVDLTENTAQGNGGGIYQNACTMTVDDKCTFQGNHSDGHGGAFYLTYSKNADGTVNGAVLNAKGTLFKGNTAMAGGAVSIRTGCKANLTNVALEENGATGTGKDASGGGAVYVGYGELNMTDVTAKGNTSAGHGGVVVAVASPVVVTGGVYENNEALSGGAFTGSQKAPLTLTNVELKGNKSTSPNKEYDTSIGGGAVNLVSSDLTVTGCTFDGNSSAYYGGTVMVAKSKASITGNTVVKNASAATGSAFYFLGDMETTLENISVTDNTSSANGVIYQNNGILLINNVEATGNKANNGGVLYVSGGKQLDVKNCTWQGNKANSGGAIYLAGPTLNVENVTFTENTAGNGGAIYDRKGTLLLKNVDFTKNHATKNGGAIDLVGAALTEPENVTFTENSADGHGGALYLTYYRPDGATDNKQDVPSTFTWTGGAFTKNTAKGGGAISVRTGCEATFDGTVFTDNHVTGDDGKVDGNGEGGGAIYVGYGKLTLKNVIVKDNTAEGLGGAVASVNSTLTINGGTFENNAAASGGALHVVEGGNVTMTGVTMTGNKSTYVQSGTYNYGMAGGAIQMAKGKLEITNCMLDGNTSAYYGGAISTSKTEVILTDSTIQNSSGATGGALCFRESNVVVKHVTIDQCKSTGSGLIYNTSGTLELDDVTITNAQVNNGILYTSSSDVTVKNCAWCTVSAQNGGVLYQSGGTVEITGMTFSGYSATSNGGVIYQKNGTLKLTDCNFTGNTANNGGAIYSTGGELVLKNVSFTKNTATKNGGAIDLVGSTIIDPENVTFEENSAGGHGGAIYLTYFRPEGATDNKNDVPGIITMTGGSFTKNTAMGGGAVSVRTGCEATFEGTVFTDNHVTGNDGKVDGNGEGGGAIYAGYGSVTLKNATVKNNTAEIFGGAVASANSTVKVIGGTFENNEAATGGVFHVVEGGTVTMSGATITGNKSTYVHSGSYDSSKAGGVIQMAKGKLEITDCTMDGNTSAYYGGAVSTSKTEVTITDSTIKNSSGATGGALCFRESNVLVKDVTLDQCKSTGSGLIYNTSGTLELDNVTVTNPEVKIGILYVSSSDVTVKGCAWSPVSTDNGSAIYQNGGTVEVIGMTFSGYSAKTNGGAIYQKGGTLKLTDCSFTGNTANNGGAIYQEGGTLKLTDTDFTGNSSRVGGAVYNRTGKLEMKNATFTENAATKNAAGEGGNGGAVMNAGGTVTGSATFKENTAENHGGAIYASYVNNEDDTRSNATITLENGTFTKNTAVAGGAISARTGCQVTVTDCTFTDNEATGTTNDKAGGAIYCNDNTLTVTGCTFDGNKTGYYGGAIAAMNCNVTINGNTKVENSVGTTGGALQFRGSGEYKLENVEITNNVEGAASGVVYITNTGSLSMKNVTGSGNQSNNGGFLYASGSGDIDIDNCSFTGNTATSNGGALSITGTSKVTVKDTAFEENTAKLGGAIHVGGAATVTVTGDSSFKGNSATKGGAVNLDKGAVFEMTGGVMDDNEATAGSAGAVYVTDTTEEGTAATTLKLTGVAVKNNTATARGGAIATDEASPNLVILATDCTFHKNYTGAGGGAIAIQNKNCNATDHPAEAKMVLTNCTFTENSCKDSGGAIEVRTQSYVKLDGITAKNNSSPANGGVIYVTSNLSRLFLTGEVVLENNTAKSGTFAQMYKVDSYTNPPKIYTTHPETAEWYSQVKGNRDVAFDMATLP